MVLTCLISPDHEAAVKTMLSLANYQEISRPLDVSWHGRVALKYNFVRAAVDSSVSTTLR